MKKVEITIVTPAFNEEKNVPVIYKQLAGVLNRLDWELIFVDDGSTDNTLIEIQKISKLDPHVKFISFSRNFGHQSALMAGLKYSRGNAVITLDCDLQHPTRLIPELLDRWRKGFDIVYTVRDDKNTGLFKKISAKMFYSIINMLSDTKIDPGAADYRLLDRKVINKILEMNESVIFLRGLISWLGYKSTYIMYLPDKRLFGTTKYSLRKMLYFAMDGITSLSVSPLRISSFIGLFLSVFSGIYGIYAVALHFTNISVISGWTSVIISVLFLGGIQLIMLGILGEYVGKTYLETKKRPTYLISEANLN